MIMQFFKELLGLNIIEHDIDRSHRRGRVNGSIKIKFTRHNTKNWIYQNKKKLKGKRFFELWKNPKKNSKIAELLTVTRKIV